MARSNCCRWLLYCLTPTLFFFILPPETRSEITTIEVSKAWIRAAPGGAKVLAGYFTITNSGPGNSKTGTDSPGVITLVSFTSTHFKKIMMHRSVIRDGVATMLHVDKFPVAAGQTSEFAPGGYHLMLMNPVTNITVGASIPVKLKFESEKEITANFTVRRQ